MKTKSQNYFFGRPLLTVVLLGLGLTLNAPAQSVFQASLSTPGEGNAQLSQGQFWQFFFRVENEQVDFMAVIFHFDPLNGSLDPILSVPGNSISFSSGSSRPASFPGLHTIVDRNPFLPASPWLPAGHDEEGNPFFIDAPVIRTGELFTGHFVLPPGFESDLLAGLGYISFNSSLGGAITVAAVPEPTVFSLAFLAGLGWCIRSRWQKSKPARLAFLLAVLSGVSVAARADTIVSSLENTPVTSVVSPVGFGNGSWAASSFRTDNQYWNLSSVTVMLGGSSSSIADLRLYSDAGGQPGVSLADLGPLTLSGGNGFSPVTFTLAGGLTLDPSTTYWVALGNTSPNQFLNVGVLFDDPFTFTGVPGASMAYSVTSSVGNGVNPPTTWLTPGPNVALLFAVEGAVVVPEPTTLSLALLAGLGWCARSRWQKSKQF